MEKKSESAYSVIGIIGGMGPLATVDLFDKIVRLTEAEKDQEHLPIVIVNTPEVPDRTKAILEGGSDPTPYLMDAALRLKAAGADFLIVPCNNSHHFLEKLSLPLPLLSMIEVTADRLKDEGVKVAAILATSGTLASDLYQKALAARGIKSVAPDSVAQKEVMKVIYDVIKAGRFDYDPTPLQKIIADLEEKGATRLILGCTELPLAVKKFGILGHFIDPTVELAKAAILEAGGRLLSDE